MTTRGMRNYQRLLSLACSRVLVGLSHLHSRQISICLTMMVINFPLLEEGKELCSFFLILTCFKNKQLLLKSVWMCLKAINLCQERYN